MGIYNGRNNHGLWILVKSCAARAARVILAAGSHLCSVVLYGQPTAWEIVDPLAGSQRWSIVKGEAYHMSDTYRLEHGWKLILTARITQEARQRATHLALSSYPER